MPTDNLSFGGEFSGVVSRVDTGVTAFTPGDRVVGLDMGGLFKSTAVTTASLLSKMPNCLSHEDAASMPICFGAVIRSLVEVGQLERHQVRTICPRCGYFTC